MMTHFSFITKGAGPAVKFRLYTDVAGDPGTLVVQAFAVGVVLGVNSVAVPQTTLLPGTYWIMGVYDVDTPIGVDGGTTNTYKFISHTLANALPSLYPAHTTQPNTQYFN